MLTISDKARLKLKEIVKIHDSAGLIRLFMRNEK